MSNARPRKTEVLNMIASLRELFAPCCLDNHADDAVAEALIATAGHDPEWWFCPDHIRAAYKRLVSK
jgi:hypothetical protein